MPNWCYNQLWVSVPEIEDDVELSKAKDELQRFKKLVYVKGKDPSENNHLSLAKIIPCPDDLLMENGPHEDIKWEERTEEQRQEVEEWKEKQLAKNKKEYGFDSWYDWSVSNWGTKWDVQASLEWDDDEMIEYAFDSAWAPPTPWMDLASKKFPTLKFQMKYDEPGMCFMGNASAKNGLYSDNSISYAD